MAEENEIGSANNPKVTWGMRAIRSAFTTILRGEGSKGLLKKGGAMMFWQATTLVFTFASTIWIARCLGPYELGRSGFIIVTSTQLLLLISVCPNTYAIRITKNSENVSLATGLVVTARALVSILYLTVLFFVFLFGLIPKEWETLAMLGMAIPILMSFQPHWLFQALENQSAQFKSSAIVGFFVCLYAAFFIRQNATGSDEVTARLIALSFGLLAGWYFTGTGNPVSYIKLDYVKPALKGIWESRTLFGTQIVMFIIAGIELPLVAYLINVEQLGMYRTATQLALGLNAFIAMLPMIYFPRFIDWQKTSSAFLWEKQKTLFVLALGFVVPTGVVIMLFGPLLFIMVFGENFSPAGLPFAILLCSKLVVMLGSIFAWGLWAKSKDLSILIVFSAVAILTVLSNLVFIPLFGIMAAASVNLFGNLCVLSVTFIMARKEGTDISITENR